MQAVFSTDFEIFGILSIKKYKIGIRSKCPGTDFTILSIQLIPNNGNFNACHFLKKKIGNFTWQELCPDLEI